MAWKKIRRNPERTFHHAIISDAFVELCDEMPCARCPSAISSSAREEPQDLLLPLRGEALIIGSPAELGPVPIPNTSESVLLYDDNRRIHLAIPYIAESGVRSLDHAEFFRCFAEVLEGRRNFYRQALVDNGPYSLRNYCTLYLEAMKRDIDIILSNRYLPRGQHRLSGRVLLCLPLLHPPLRHQSVRSIGGQAGLRQHHSSLEKNSEARCGAICK
ncbi:MAG: TetR family transcriptional regulator [Eggerthellaceae bacterium]